SNNGPWNKYKASEQAQPEQKPDSNYLMDTAKNIPGSFANYAGCVVGALAHPIDTTQGRLNLANSGLQAALPDSVNNFMHKISPDTAANEGLAGKFADYEKSRYGSLAQAAETFKNDPVGVVGDASLLLGGAGLVPGMAKAGKLGAAIEPINVTMKAAGKAVPAVGKVAGQLISEYGTHTGPDALNTAAKAGYSGGSKLKDFADNMRGKAEQADVVPELKQALKNMRKADFEKYSREIQGVKEDPSLLSFQDINSAAKRAMDIDTYKGLSGQARPINLNSASDKAKADIVKKLNEFKRSDPQEFHTPGGFDALKRSIGKIDTPPGTPQRRVVDSVYNAVKDEIIKAYPEYGKIMEESSTRMKIAKEMERSLSLGEGAMVDTALRKLQSITRNNANTNYGSRTKQAEELNAFSESGNLMEKLSGQTLNAIKPRGLGGIVAGGLGGYGIAAANPAVIPLMAMQSPRIMGETAMKLGQMARYAKKGSKIANPKLINLAHTQRNNKE
ncbi:MAG: hypothetical protein WC449_05855, partial [Candidatus Paceibacterota bacterium]